MSEVQTRKKNEISANMFVANAPSFFVATWFMLLVPFYCSFILREHPEDFRWHFFSCLYTLTD